MEIQGFIVVTQEGKIGRTYHKHSTIMGKVRVYLKLENGIFMHTPVLRYSDTLKVIGVWEEESKFIFLTKSEVEADRSSAYNYLL